MALARAATSPCGSTAPHTATRTLSSTQCIDRIEEAGMHLREIDRAEIGDARHPPARASAAVHPGKPKPLLITETFLCVFRRKAATDDDASDASVVKTKRAASAISAG